MIVKIMAILMISFITKDSYWVTVSKGAALHLNPFTNKWEPISNKEQVREHTFVLTKENSEIIVYKDDQTAVIGSNMHVYLNDLFVDGNRELLSKLNKIEMDQLPKSNDANKNKNRSVGLTFGKLKVSEFQSDIPFLSERINGINHLDRTKNKRASLLSLKRLMTKYPDLYQDLNYTKKLFKYYEQFNLKGMIYDESLMLKQSDIEGEVKNFIDASHQKIKDELTKHEN